MSWLWLLRVGFAMWRGRLCLGLGQCFWGSPECAGDGFLWIIDLFYYKLKEIRETTMSIYSNQR